MQIQSISKRNRANHPTFTYALIAIFIFLTYTLWHAALRQCPPPPACPSTTVDSTPQPSTPNIAAYVGVMVGVAYCSNTACVDWFLSMPHTQSPPPPPPHTHTPQTHTQTGFVDDRYTQDANNYIHRRTALRNTWFPKDKAGHQQYVCMVPPGCVVVPPYTHTYIHTYTLMVNTLTHTHTHTWSTNTHRLADQGIVMRFVLGKGDSPKQERQVVTEIQQYDDYLRLPIPVGGVLLLLVFSSMYYVVCIMLCIIVCAFGITVCAFGITVCAFGVCMCIWCCL